MARDEGQGQPQVYRTIWRWHFYAGLFVLPLVMLLSLSGMCYLFKPQIDRWEERGFRNLSVAGSATPQQQVLTVLGSYEGATLLDYRLPEQPDDAAMVRIVDQHQQLHEVFVASDAMVLGSIDPDTRLMAIVKRVHSELLIAGKVGNGLVELAACWAIVLLASGLYLWWPRRRGLAGTLWPRVSSGKRVFWRDLHAVTGIWVSAFALVLLLTGLPWAGVWGSALQALRSEMGWVKGSAAWQVDTESAQTTTAAGAHEHDNDMHAVAAASYSLDALDAMVARAATLQLAPPVVVTVPGGPGRFGEPGDLVWTIRSDTLNVPRQQLIRFDAEGRTQLAHERFEDGHPIDRVVGYGIAWHQGQLFGWVTQLIGVLTAMGLVLMALSAFMLWRGHKPAGKLGAPLQASAPPLMAGAMLILAILALLLPLLAASLVALWLLERLLLPRMPALAEWLGVTSR